MNRQLGQSEERTLHGLDSGPEAPRESPEFTGPVEPAADHATDRLALSDENAREAGLPGTERTERWAFSVDDGIGVDPEKADRVFEAVERPHREYAGTAICRSPRREIVDGDGGTICVDSEPGKGSTFTVTIPRRTGE